MAHLLSLFKFWQINLFTLANVTITCVVLFIQFCDSVIASDETGIHPIPDHISTEKWTGDFDGMVERKKFVCLFRLTKCYFF